MKSKLCSFIVFLLFLGAWTSSNHSHAQLSKEQWPSFRGAGARGISEAAPTPVSWNMDDETNIKWKTPIPGLSHSSPIVWDDLIFVTTAESGGADEELKVGLYGEGDPVDKELPHDWKLFCLDKRSGKVLWERTAVSGVPEAKRHPKSTHANSTPATDGKYVVAFFGSEGLYCYDMAGNPMWEVDFGVLISSPYDGLWAEWGFASSPIIHDARVIVQCDVKSESFIAALDLETGKEIWRTPRDENTSWSTPSVYFDGEQTRIAVNGYKHIGGYDFETGREVWKMRGGGDIPVPTPVMVDDLLYINNAHGKMAPIYAIRTDATGEITLDEDETSNEAILWSVRRDGAYMQTPLVYGDYLYNLRGNGQLFCFNAKTGERMYKEKLGKALGAFSASAVAAQGKLYFTGEEGDIFVVKAGPKYELLAANTMNEICMATPAILEGALYFRTRHHLVAVSE